ILRVCLGGSRRQVANEKLEVMPEPTKSANECHGLVEGMEPVEVVSGIEVFLEDVSLKRICDRRDSNELADIVIRQKKMGQAVNPEVGLQFLTVIVAGACRLCGHHDQVTSRRQLVIDVPAQE